MVSGKELMKDYEKTYEDFWKKICQPNGELDMDAVKRELHDYHTLLENVPKVYDHVTGGRVSKPNTDPAVVMSEADQHYSEFYDPHFDTSR